MGKKGIQTKGLIQENAYLLFAEKGFAAVTMKDICEVCGLSRGGLYRHYGSTKEIFEEILQGIADMDFDFIKEGIGKEQSARKILNQILEKMQRELLDEENSLSCAIYEYSCHCKNDFMIEMNQRAKQKWTLLLEYGIKNEEFKPVDIESMVDIILYAYQGIRMWEQVIPIDVKTVENVLEKIRKDLVGDYDRV